MLDHGHNHYLILASLAIALMSGFTGLSLTQGASRMSIPRRKLVVAMSAIALGSGIWSMHFVAMLGMTLPVQFFYDALITLISAFVAILVTGVALLLVHFGERTALRITLAGVCLAVGIVAMHYIGMSGIQVVRPVYSVAGIIVAFVSALLLCIVSFWISYGGRHSRNILVGTVGFGVAVVSVHFIAMMGTRFMVVSDNTADHVGFWLSNDILAFGVTVSSFVISGAFLLVSVSFGSQPVAITAPVADVSLEPEPEVDATTDTVARRIPFEQNGRIQFISADEVAAVRAEGRYTFLYTRQGRLFSPWSISESDRRLTPAGFVRSHRSYMLNPVFVSGFERKKDNGICYFEPGQYIENAPVSRSHLKNVRDVLGV